MNIDPDALQQNDDPDDGEDIYAGLPWNHCARFDGHPGMVWYSKVRKVPGDQHRHVQRRRHRDRALRRRVRRRRPEFAGHP